MDWQPIETAPKDGRAVFLKSPQHAPRHVFRWSGKNRRWECKIYAIARAVDGWWDTDAQQPTHWRFPPPITGS